MPTLSRQQTRESILSWWSDRNPRGATIDLHAASKPLMRFLYHQQVLGFIKRNHGIPLSSGAIQICSDYLAFKYLSPSTKIAILEELANRIKLVEEARAVMHSLGVPRITYLLEDENAEVRKWTCEILGGLAYHESTAMAVSKLETCLRLVSLSSTDDMTVIDAAIYALSQITQWPDGARAAVEGKVQDKLAQLLQSSIAGVRRWTCWMAGRLASHDSTAAAVLDLNPAARIVSLLRDKDIEVVEGAMYALSQISRWPEGAQAVVDSNILNYVQLLGSPIILSHVIEALVQIAEWSGIEQAVLDAKVLDHVVELFESQNPSIRRWACSTVTRLTQRAFEAGAFSALTICVHLVSLLRDEDERVVHEAIGALDCITNEPGGAQAALDAKLLDHVPQLLLSPYRGMASSLVWKIVIYDSTVIAAWASNLWVQIISRLRDEDAGVFENAIWALGKLAEWSGSEQAGLDAKVLDHIAELFESPSSRIRRWACSTVAKLAQNSSEAGAFSALNLCVHLVSLLRDEDTEVVAAALEALIHIAQWPDGAQAAINVKLLDHIPELLLSPYRDMASSLVGKIAIHDSAAIAVLVPKFGVQIISRLRDKNARVVENAIWALGKIDEWPGFEQAGLDATVLDHMAELLKSPYPRIRRWACSTAAKLAQRASEAGAFSAVNLCVHLVSLLRDKDTEIVTDVIQALIHIAQWPDGVQATINAKLLDHVPNLLLSPHRGMASALLGEIVLYDSTVIAGSAPEFWVQIESRLRDEDAGVVENAMWALAKITEFSGSEQTALEAKLLVHLTELFRSPNAHVRRWTCSTVAKLASHSKAGAVSALNLCVPLVSLLRDEDTKVVVDAFDALIHIVQWPDGAQASVKANVLGDVAALFESPNLRIRRLTCSTVGWLAHHDCTAVAVLALNPCVQLVCLLCDADAEVVQGALFALSRISQWPKGAQAVIEAKSLHYFAELLESPDEGVRATACEMLGMLASHELTSTAEALLRVGSCARLVLLLQDAFLSVCKNAVLALATISEFTAGIPAFIHAGILEHLSELMESGDREVQFNTCLILRNLTRYPPRDPGTSRNFCL